MRVLLPEHYDILSENSENDVEMLELAGFSYAMKNAENKAKEAARFQAPANTEAGVLQVIEQYLKES